MCEFILDYEYSKLFKRRMDKLTEEVEDQQQPELAKVEEQPLVDSKWSGYAISSRASA
jgi:hypothetical protein